MIISLRHSNNYCIRASQGIKSSLRWEWDSHGGSIVKRSGTDANYSAVSAKEIATAWNIGVSTTRSVGDRHSRCRFLSGLRPIGDFDSTLNHNSPYEFQML